MGGVLFLLLTDKMHLRQSGPIKAESDRISPIGAEICRMRTTYLPSDVPGNRLIERYYDALTTRKFQKDHFLFSGVFAVTSMREWGRNSGYLKGLNWWDGGA